MLAPVEEGITVPLPEAVVERVTSAIRRLPPGELRPEDVTTEDLYLFGTWDMACYYAPLDHIDPRARVVLVATCPPVTLAAAAHAVARDALWAGLPPAEAWRRAALAAAPSGGFETNLAHMLDGLGVAPGLGVSTVRTEIGVLGGLIHMTHCVRYPLLVNDRDYTGRRPRLLRAQALRPFLHDLLAPALEAMPEALIVPLGRVPGEAVAALVDAGRLDIERCIFGVPNPSGANGHREDDYERSRDELAEQVAAWFAAHPVKRTARMRAV